MTDCTDRHLTVGCTTNDANVEEVPLCKRQSMTITPH